MNIPTLNVKDYHDIDSGARVNRHDFAYSLTEAIRCNMGWGRDPVLVDPELLLVFAERLDEISGRLGLPPLRLP